ncbi:Serine carboxypeptidase-like 29 [Forsythia ovata]|uniref:Serine carboxypeptidase-like 29 n=1 Tax=Forsythia ovata TaxID=205694 RepID=A0ABD1SNZ3_9LAMI
MSTLNRVFNIFLFIFIGKLHLIGCRASLSLDPDGQQELDRVSKLPGQNFNVSFAHYAGYVTVNEESGRALFYWLFEAEEEPSSKPLVLWLNGGPGCSAIGYGLSEEIGPFHVEKDGKTLYLNPDSWNKEQCNEVLDISLEEMGDIDIYSIFTPPCTANFNRFNQLLKRKKKVGLIKRAYDPCTLQHSVIYFNLPEVQNALHVHSKNSPSKWETCSDEVNKNWKDSATSVLNIYRELIHLGLRIWIFSGDADAVVPVTSTRYSIDSLELPTISPWRAWYDNGQVGGWIQEYQGLTFVVVRGAGHEVPLHKPKQALTLIKSFLSGTSMPKTGNIE